MILSEIYNRIVSNLVNNNFLLCDNFTLQNGDISKLLNTAFFLESIQLTNVTQKFDNEILVTGNAVGLDNTLITLKFIQKSSIDVTVQLSQKMPDNWIFALDSASAYNITAALRSFYIDTDIKTVERFLDGKVYLGDLVFCAHGTFDIKNENWNVNLTASQNYHLPVMVKSFLKVMGLPPISTDFLPSIGFSKLEYTFETKSLVNRVMDVMAIKVLSHGNVEVIEGLSFSDFGFLINKSGQWYEFKFTSEAFIAGTKFPISAYYDGSGFIIGVNSLFDQAIKIPSIGDLAQVAKIDLSQIFPSEILNFNKLALNYLLIHLTADFSSIALVDVLVSTEKDWEFFSVKGLALSDLSFGFKHSSSDTDYIIMGNISIGSGANKLVISLSASYTSGQWTFSGFLPMNQSLNLTTLANDLANMLSVGMGPLPIPEVVLDWANVSFSLRDKSFAASAKVFVFSDEACLDASTTILDKLFKISAEVNIISSVREGERTYKGEFKGELQLGQIYFEVSYKFDKSGGENKVKAVLSSKSPNGEIKLTDVLQGFGVEAIPEFINTLNLSITNIGIEYDISKGELQVIVSSSNFGSITAIVKDKTYDVRISFNDFSLSALPVVGTSLRLLDNVKVKNLQFLVLSEDCPAPPVKSGVSLAGQVLENEFAIQISHKAHMSAENNNEPKWFKIGKSIGIFEFSRIGVGYMDNRVVLLLDAGLVTNAVHLELMGLGLGIDVSSPKDINFHLSGLSIDFHNGGLAISGAFLASGEKYDEQYDGSLLLSYGKLSLYATGMYKKDSLMAFALLSAKLGGCPPFFVTGLAAGFGYNVNIIMPEITEVEKFPLVAGALDTMSKSDMAQKMKEIVKPEKGQNFLAAGVRFTSFNLADSFLLAVVSFGNHVEANLLGLTKISAPPNLPREKNPLVYAELALKAFLSPEAGVVSVLAQLTSESYIFSKECKLTGGFAFKLWFGGEHKGDFVITLGGYHPQYKKSAHYPDVPRLAFRWPVIQDKLEVNGELYFALTPSTLMAGGRLGAVYHDGDLKAWFTAKADFYVAWQPFHYDINLYIAIGASYHLKAAFIDRTFSTELVAQLHLWGPNFSGTAHISWYIISFDIAFGTAEKDKPKPLSWDEFKKSFLGKSDQTCTQLAGPAINPIVISVSKGLRFEAEAGSKTYPVVYSDDLALIVQSSLPSTSIYVNGAEIAAESNPLGVLPMGEGITLTSTFTVELRDKDKKRRECTVEPIEDNVPRALWGKVHSGNELISHTTTGLQITPKQIDYNLIPADASIDLNRFSIYSRIEKKFKWNQSWILNLLVHQNSKEIFAQTVMSQSVQTKRASFVKALNAGGFDFDDKIDLSKLMHGAEYLFHEDILLAELV